VRGLCKSKRPPSQGATMKAYIKVKNTYGVDKIYPDCDVSRSLVNLMNTKTIPLEKVYWIRQLGIELEQRPVELKDLL